MDIIDIANQYMLEMDMILKDKEFKEYKTLAFGFIQGYSLD